MSKIEKLIREEIEATESNPDAPLSPQVKSSRPNRIRSTVYSIRLSIDEVAAVQDLADAANLPASTLVRSWIIERIHSVLGETGDAAAELRAIQLHVTHLQRQIAGDSSSRT